MSQQISESYADLAIDIGGRKIPLPEMCGGVMVTGATGSGKTVSVINRLALQFAGLSADNRKRQPAIIYFVVKGRPHVDFVRSLPAHRRKDVIEVSLADECQVGIDLFCPETWPSLEALDDAVPAFVEEFATHLSDSIASQRHDPYWQRQRVRVLTCLSRLRSAVPQEQHSIPRDVRWLHAGEPIGRLIARLNAFLEHTLKTRDRQQKQPATTDIAALLARHDFTGAAQEEAASLMKRYLNHPHAILSTEDLIFLQRLIGVTSEVFGCAGDATKENESPLENFFYKLAWSSNESLRALLNDWYAMADSTRGCIQADLRGVTEVFERGPMQAVFGPQRQRRITFEEIIQRGKILILNLPLGESGDATWPVLVAAKLTLFARLLGRAGATWQAKPLSHRPVAIFIDEFHCLATRGRFGGEDNFLARCREFGVTTVLATQSLSILGGVMRDPDKLGALIGNCRTRFFGQNTDELTNRTAATCCGLQSGTSIQRTPVWHESARYRAAVTDRGGEDRLLIEPHRFADLGTGEFFCVTPTHGVHRINYDHRLARPTVTTLRDPHSTHEMPGVSPS